MTGRPREIIDGHVHMWDTSSHELPWLAATGHPDASTAQQLVDQIIQCPSARRIHA